ncbi:PIN domain nuclease, a component of toxin-antitoxin system (PIN domain) [Paracoccus halophilus]|uniref:PIN domain nuclease, a component of toxin-antitoxin system (PIN domain) n=1 Tax=Paracoccus halophilus TaxID=376733 RepID=A0A099EUZ1_9RHOB|nr:type II toxin-antitoxin system VapC family toxin [Paracoccus halophilus]KGJ01826.1 hypothetical protein IT41_19170 [Paracoccus halophilus]SFA62594.1 PIN domain nuclease, a component of toxin-antitoxin system (PIN domain) [Paracoccus halophilus]
MWRLLDFRRSPDEFDRIGEAEIRAMFDPANRLWFSAGSIWEEAITRALDRADFRVEAGVLSNDHAELPMEGRHRLGPGSLPALHGDPFDRMLIAQAVVEGMMLLTTDTRIGACEGPIRLV